MPTIADQVACPLPDPLVVEVTAAHLRAGRRQMCHDCPVALALEDALERVVPASDRWSSAVFSEHVSARRMGEWKREWRADLPPSAVAFVAAFDRGDDPASAPWLVPFRFELTDWVEVRDADS